MHCPGARLVDHAPTCPASSEGIFGIFEVKKISLVHRPDRANHLTPEHNAGKTRPFDSRWFGRQVERDNIAGEKLRHRPRRRSANEFACWTRKAETALLGSAVVPFKPGRDQAGAGVGLGR